MVLKAKWKGRGLEEPGFEYLDGVPARDLSEEEYEALDTEQKRRVRTSSLYDVRLERKASDKDSG